MSLNNTLDSISKVIRIALQAAGLVAFLQTQIHLAPPAPTVVALPLTTLQIPHK